MRDFLCAIVMILVRAVFGVFYVLRGAVGGTLRRLRELVTGRVD